MAGVKGINIEKAAVFILALAAFMLTNWRFFGNQCFALVALIVIFYRPWRKQLFCLDWFKEPLILWTLIFIGFVFCSLSYSQTPNFLNALQGVEIYSRLLYLLVFAVVLQATPYRRWLENGLIYGVFINVILSTLYYYGIPGVSALLEPHMSMNATFTVNPLQVIYVVVMAIWLLGMRILNREFSSWDIVVLVLLTFYLWVVNIERSGFLLFLALVLFFLTQYCGKKGFLLGCLLLPLFLLGLYYMLPNVKARVDIGIQNVLAFQAAQSSQQIGTNNSLGVRLAFLSETIQVIKDRPLLGTGIGNFKYVYAHRFSEQAKTVIVNDPHNAYAYVAFELGLIGLAIYCIWLYQAWRLTGRLRLEDRILLRGIWLIFVLMGFTDSGFALNAVGMSFILWFSLYLRGQKQ